MKNAELRDQPDHCSQLAVVNDSAPTGIDKCCRSNSRLRRRFSDFWLKLNIQWADAREMQKRIDDARTEQLVKYNHIRWHI